MGKTTVVSFSSITACASALFSADAKPDAFIALVRDMFVELGGVDKSTFEKLGVSAEAGLWHDIGTDVEVGTYLENALNADGKTAVLATLTVKFQLCATGRVRICISTPSKTSDRQVYTSDGYCASNLYQREVQDVARIRGAIRAWLRWMLSQVKPVLVCHQQRLKDLRNLHACLLKNVVRCAK